MIRSEWRLLLTKGLLPRVFYNGAQSIMFFNMLLYMGKLYKVDLNDD